MDDQYIWVLAEAINEFFSMSLWFSCGWFLFYVILGPWLQVRLCRFKTQDISTAKNSVWPVFVSHLLFSILLINPFVMIWLIWHLDDISKSTIVNICLMIVYFLILPICFDLLILKGISRWKKLRWFRWQISLKRLIPVILFLCFIAFGAGFVSVQLRDIMPAIARAFPLRPKAFSWKLDTETKPLIDHSVSAESDPMFTDDKYIFVRVTTRNPTWIVVDRTTHKVIAREPTTLGYVLAEDQGGTWQIKKDPNGIEYSRLGENDSKTIPIRISRQAIFLKHQVAGLIIGADPSSGHLFAIDPKTEQIAWKVQAPAVKHNNDRRIGSIAGTEDVIAAGLWSSRVWAVDTKTGQRLWLFEEKGCGNSIYVKASKDSIIGVSLLDKIYSFSPRTGEIKWCKQLGDPSEWCVYLLGDKLIFYDENTITCAGIDSGSIYWQSNFGDHYSRGLSCCQQGIIACTCDRTLALLNASSGQELLRTKFSTRSGMGYNLRNLVEKEPGRIYVHPIVTDNSEVYVFTSDGILWALKPDI